MDALLRELQRRAEAGDREARRALERRLNRLAGEALIFVAPKVPEAPDRGPPPVLSLRNPQRGEGGLCRLFVKAQARRRERAAPHRRARREVKRHQRRGDWEDELTDDGPPAQAA